MGIIQDDHTMKCVTGVVLHVDLTTGEIRKEKIPEAVYDHVLSGKGLGAWYLNKYIPVDADPLGPENILGFVSGALTGTGAFMCGRWMAVCKSPLTGGWGDANCGGMFSPAIKQCGFDAIFFKGISEKPVYLYCDNKTIELRDASAYWGMDATEAEIRLQEDNRVKKKPCVALIGQAGENQSLIAGICNEGGRIAARSGVGAVMGSKRLKAVVLAGSKPMPCADREAIHEISRKTGRKMKKLNLPGAVKGSLMGVGGTMLGKLPVNAAIDGSMIALLSRKWGTPFNTTLAINSGDGPIKNWSAGPEAAKGSVKVFNPDKVLKREVSKYHCYSCSLGCGGSLEISDATKGEYTHTHKPEYETIQAFGALLLNNDLESIYYINEMLNRAGMDSISAGATVAYAVECYERGLLTKKDTDGLELTWGNTDAIIQLVKKMIAREGIGDILADGSKRAAEKLGGAEYAMHVGGQEAGMHDSRNDPQLGIHFVTEPAPGKHTVGMTIMYGTFGLADHCSWAPPMTLLNKKDELEPSKTIALRAIANACYTMVTDGAGGCYYGQMSGLHLWNPFEYLNKAAGWDKTGDDYMEMGKRIQTMRQLFNVRHGIKPAAWKLTDRMAGKPPLKKGPLKGVTLKNEEQVKDYWELIGWDRETGVPLDKTLEDMGIKTLMELEVETIG